ncbi:MAG: disulfide bond formation protein B [Rhodospirillaceae bacterium]|nr:disulfide bond formation protein B [Rhodospirillaceae bacterium]
MAASADKGWQATAAVTLAAAGILAVAYVAQYGFGLWPCSLCYVQRVPYFVVVVLGALALMPAVDARSRRIVLFHLAGLFFLEAGLALYHAGVEMHWWQGPTACTGSMGAVSLDDLTSALSKPGNPLCDEPAFLFMGISMAGYNVFAALVLGVASTVAALRKPWWARA